MSNLKTLKPYKKGSKRASECAKKQKRGISIVRAIKEQFESGNVNLKLVSKGMCLMMAKNPAMARLVMEYIDGKVPDRLQTDFNVNIGLPLQLPGEGKKKVIASKGKKCKK